MHFFTTSDSEPLVLLRYRASSWVNCPRCLDLLSDSFAVEFGALACPRSWSFVRSALENVALVCSLSFCPLNKHKASFHEEMLKFMCVIHVPMCVHTGAHVRTCVEISSQQWCHPLSLATFLFETGSLTERGALIWLD